MSSKHSASVTSKKKKKENNKNNVVLLLLFLFGLILFIYSIINIVGWYKDSKSASKIISEINNIASVTEIDDSSENTQIVESENIESSNPYWDYIKMKLIDVDFSELKKINPETVGWVQVSGTNVNYPFVKHSDNQFYLKHSFDKSPNSAGWVFMDYRNDINFSDKNTILYAHSRADKTMFTSLKNIIKDKNWYNDKNNHVIKLSTESTNSLWQIFSVYHIPTTDDYLVTNFSSEQNFKNFTDMIKNRSFYNFNTNVSPDDKILTLSTCYNSKDKMVIHAKLIKYSSKN